MSKFPVNEALALIDEGKSLKQASEILGVYRSTLTRYVQYHRPDWKHEGVGGPRKDVSATQIIAGLEQGKTKKQLADEFGVTYRTIYNRLKDEQARISKLDG